MTQGKFSKEEAVSCEEALNEIMKEAVPKSRCAEYIGHFNDLFLFLTAAKEAAPSEKET